MKFAFAGTPLVASWVLQDLLATGRRPELVLTQPDKPAGRGRRCTPPPVLETARQAGLPRLQTGNINDGAVLDALGASGAEVLVVAAFGQIFRAELLERFFCLNVHPSLLPAYRGAAPVRRALLAGERETGVCLIRLIAELDAGPWALRRRLSITPRDDYGTLSRALAQLGALGAAETLTAMEDGTDDWTEQEGEASYASKVGHDDRLLDLDVAAERAHDRVRGLAPDIGAEAVTNGVSVKVWRSWPVGGDNLAGLPAAEVAGRPGALLRTKHRVWAGCRTGALELLEVQPAGKRRMSADEFLRGYGNRLGERLEPGRAQADPTPVAATERQTNDEDRRL